MAKKHMTLSQMSKYLSGVKRIAVLGDSMSVKNYAWEPSWAERLEGTLNQNNVPCEVRSFAVNADTFYRINTTEDHGGLTALMACVEYKPDVVITVAAINDCVDSLDERTLTQVKADADYTFSFLRAALPKAEIYYGEQQPYDTSNFTGATLKNKGAPPKLMTLKSSGVFTSLIYPAILSDNLGSSYRTQFTNYDALNTYIKANANLTGHFGMRAWKIARLGTLNPDRYHFNSAGML